jgi:hypothetical protein
LHGQLNTSIGLLRLVEKYADAIRKVSVSFYSHAIAEQGARRVEV